MARLVGRLGSMYRVTYGSHVAPRLHLRWSALFGVDPLDKSPLSDHPARQGQLDPGEMEIAPDLVIDGHPA